MAALTTQQVGKDSRDIINQDMESTMFMKRRKYIVTLNKEHYKQLYFAFSTSNYYKNMTPKDKLAGVNPDNPVDLRLVTTGKESFNADNTQYVFGMMSIVSENSEYIGDIKSSTTRLLIHIR